MQARIGDISFNERVILMEYEFNLRDVFDTDNEYDLFICAVSFALSDLSILNRKISECDNESKESTFYYRLALGFMREAYMLLKRKFDNEGFRTKYLLPIPNAVEKYTEIDNIVFGKNDNNSFGEYKINDTRHQIFHYPKEREDYDLLKCSLEYLAKDNKELNYYESDDTDIFHNQSFDFAQTIQLNILNGTYKKDEIEISKNVSELASLNAKIINLLDLLFSNFLIKKLQK